MPLHWVCWHYFATTNCQKKHASIDAKKWYASRHLWWAIMNSFCTGTVNPATFNNASVVLLELSFYVSSTVDERDIWAAWLNYIKDYTTIFLLLAVCHKIMHSKSIIKKKNAHRGSHTFCFQRSELYLLHIDIPYWYFSANVRTTTCYKI